MPRPESACVGHCAAGRADGGELRIESPEGNQRQGDDDFVFDDSFGRGFTELTPVSPKFKVHGLGTRKTGNGHTVPNIVAYSQDIRSLFGAGANSFTSAAG